VISLRSAESLHQEYKSVESQSREVKRVESQVAERQESVGIPEVLSEQSASEVSS
jgi:hypothetical protein